MAPGLGTLKSITDRLNIVRRSQRQYPIADDEKGEPSRASQPLGPELALATASQNVGPAQPKKVSGEARHTRSHPPSAMAPKAPKHPKQGPGSLSNYTYAPENMPFMTSSPSPLFHSNPFAVAEPATAGSSQQAASTHKAFASYGQAHGGSLGSRNNPIDLTDSPTSDVPYKHPFKLHPTQAQVPSMAKKNILPGYTTVTSGTIPPSKPPTSSSAQKPTPGNASFLPVGFPPAPLDASGAPHWTPFTAAWLGPVPPPGNTHVPWGPNPQFEGIFAQGGHMMSIFGDTEYLDAALPPPPNPLSGMDTTMVDIASAEEGSDSSADPEPPEDTAALDAALKDVDPVRKFVRKCLGRPCAVCHKTRAMDSKDVTKMTTGWVNMKGELLLGSTCQNWPCKACTCLGCGKVVSTSMAGGMKYCPETTGPPIRMYWCCDQGRLAAIWALACGWPAPNPKSRIGPSVVTKVRARARATLLSSDPLSSHMPATAKGVGYGSQYLTRPRLAARPASSRKIVQIREDLVIEPYFKLLTLLLPSRKQTSPLDACPPDFLSSMLSRSPLIEKAAMMLSNDSIEEISGQNQLYSVLLDFVEILGNHSATAGLVHNDRNLYYAKGGNLLEASFDDGKGNGRIVVKDTGKSLAALLSKLAAQSQTTLRHARANPSEFQNREGRTLLQLSQRLSEVATQHAANMYRFQTAMDIDSNDSKVAFNFAEWHRENCVRDAPDEKIRENFAFTRDIERGASTNPIRGRMKRLITELSTLQTSLPEGIFLFHGASRLDMMKILIIGPKNTPYEHGLFEFDLFCPLDYPNSPPKMQFKTTNNGRTRFNPNLYEDGKICLSLLGTWSGEPWRPNQSTILQVLVSIQSMILCEQPWYNEPGREISENKSMSAKYNEDVRCWTMQYAQLPWIEAIEANEASKANQIVPAPTSVTSLWKETVRLYLLTNAEEIRSVSQKVSSRPRVPVLQSAAQSVIAALRTKGYLDQDNQI
ncbi:hypothetical protein F5Y04DRAFT_87007 [Hypomontagnella monticulosa]|nr:hypothetical protein F5Y04DRAFT_87007 [Hypomontagnella monticulosa]